MQESAGREPSLSLPRYTEKQKQKRTRSRGISDETVATTGTRRKRLSRKEVFPVLLDFAYAQSAATGLLPDTPERRCSSRTFRYGYLVTT